MLQVLSDSRELSLGESTHLLPKAVGVVEASPIHVQVHALPATTPPVNPLKANRNRQLIKPLEVFIIVQQVLCQSCHHRCTDIRTGANDTPPFRAWNVTSPAKAGDAIIPSKMTHFYLKEAVLSPFRDGATTCGQTPTTWVYRLTEAKVL